jgi:hypothetical protein
MSLSRVNVQSMKGGLARDIPVDLQHDTIAVLKRRVAASFGGFMHTSEMKLVYKAKPLVQEGATLTEVGIKAETTVHLVFRMHGGGHTGEMVSACSQERVPVSEASAQRPSWAGEAFCLCCQTRLHCTARHED